MGNAASSAIAENQLNETMKQINESLGDGSKKKEDGAAPQRREQEQKKKDREEAFREKQAERKERKAKLSDQWAAHKAANSDAPNSKKSTGFFG